MSSTTRVSTATTPTGDMTIYAQYALKKTDYKGKYIDGLVTVDPVAKKCTRLVG